MASRFISRACDTFCIRAKFGLTHHYKVKFKQIFAIIMSKNSKGKQVQIYDKTAILGFVFTQNALKNLFTTLAYKAMTRITLSLSLSLASFLFEIYFFNPLNPFARFVILSLCKKVKNPQRLKENLPFLDTSLTLSMTKRVFGMTEQIGMINLGCRLNFLEQMKNLKNLKNLQIFLKIFC